MTTPIDIQLLISISLVTASLGADRMQYSSLPPCRKRGFNSTSEIVRAPFCACEKKSNCEQNARSEGRERSNHERNLCLCGPAKSKHSLLTGMTLLKRPSLVLTVNSVFLNSSKHIGHSRFLRSNHRKVNKLHATAWVMSLSLHTSSYTFTASELCTWVNILCHFAEFEKITRLFRSGKVFECERGSQEGVLLTWWGTLWCGLCHV